MIGSVGRCWEGGVVKGEGKEKERGGWEGFVVA